MSWAAVAAGGGALLNAYTNSRAADKAADATRQSAAEIRAAEAQKQATLNELKGQTQTGTDYLRKTVNESGDLTAAQRGQLTDLRRSTGNQIRTSSIAGSGRTAAGLLRSTEDRFVNDALDSNRGRSIGAAGTLAGMYGTAVSGVANSQSDSGRLSAGLNRDAGIYGASADVANGKLAGTALGAVGRAVTSYNKPNNGQPLNILPSKYSLRNSDDSPYQGNPGGTGGDLGGYY